HATGNLFTIHDDDDTWHPDFLKECVSFLSDPSNSSQFGGVVTHASLIRERIDGDDVVILSEEDFNSHHKYISLFEVAAGNIFTVNSFVYHRKIWEKIRGYNQHLPVLGDWEFNLRVLSTWDLGLIPKRLANYHIRVNQINDIYSNTVTDPSHLHVHYGNLMRNHFLRDDLRNAKPGLGFIMNTALSFHRIQDMRYQFDELKFKLQEISEQLQATKEQLQVIRPIVTEIQYSVGVLYSWISKVIAPLRWMKRVMRRLF
ncbi:MAG: hypothetical protein AAB116_06480, partial [Candidatus Poribacteria bacterium]